MNPLKSEMLNQLWRYGPTMTPKLAGAVTDALKPVIGAHAQRADAAEAEAKQLRALLQQVLDASEDACGECTKDPCPWCTAMTRVQWVLLDREARVEGR